MLHLYFICRQLVVDIYILFLKQLTYNRVEQFLVFFSFQVIIIKYFGGSYDTQSAPLISRDLEHTYWFVCGLTEWTWVNNSKWRFDWSQRDSLRVHQVTYLLLHVVFLHSVEMAGVLRETPDYALEVVINKSILYETFLGMVVFLLKNSAQYLSARDANTEVLKEKIEILA